MKLEADIFSTDDIGEKLLILELCIWVGKIEFSIWYKVKVVGYLDSTVFICPTYQISEILNVWKFFLFCFFNFLKTLRFCDTAWS